MKVPVRALIFGVGSQAVSSAANFAFGAILVRALPVQTFGAYSLGFALVMLAFNLADALFLTPLTMAVARAGDRATGYARSVLVQSLPVSAAIATAVAAVAAGIFAGTPPAAASDAFVFAAVGASSFAFAVKETVTRCAYALRRELVVLLVNLVFGAALIGLAIWSWSSPGDASGALTLQCAAGLIAAAAGIVLLGFHRGAGWWRTVDRCRAVRPLFVEGRWYCGANLAYWLRLQAPNLLATWLLGLGAVGTANAGRLLVTPAVMLTPALGQVALPRLAALAGDRDGRTFGRAWSLFAVAVVTATAGYSLLLLAAGEPGAELLLGGRAHVPRAMVAGWCCFALALAVRNAVEIRMKAISQVKPLFRANALAGLVAVPVCALAMTAWGEIGIPIGAAISELILPAAALRAREADARARSRPEHARPPH